MTARVSHLSPNEPVPGVGVLELNGPWSVATKQYLVRAKDVLHERHRAGGSGREIVEAYTRVIDHVVRTLFEAAQASYRERYAVIDQRCTLVAQGGYGRGELNPCSDIDLLFLYPYRRDAYVETVTERMLYALWDTGILEVGHAVRNARECVQLAARDFKVKTALLLVRYVSGDQALYAEFTTAMENEVLKRNASRFYREKAAENEERRRRFGDSVYLVEPHLKDGAGGLRDLHTAMWLARVKYRVSSIAELVQKGILTEREHAEIEAAQDFVFRVRNSLHFITGKHQDHLTFELQAKVAEEIGFRDDGPLRAVEHFMRAYYTHAATLNRFCDEMVERCLTAPRSARLLGVLGGRQIRPGVRVAANEIVVGDPNSFRNDPTLLIRVFADAQRHGLPISNFTRRVIRNSVALVDDRVRQDPEAVRAFFDILRWRSGVFQTLYEMHKLGVLGAFLPEFGHLTCMPQYEMSHIYTVDEHTLRGVQVLERLLRGELKEQAPHLTEVMRDIDRADILYLGMLLHDIGKGRGGNHSCRGAEMIGAVAERLRLNDDHARQLDCLVRHHLLMAFLATRRDVHDEKLIIEFATTVATLDNLKKLYLLTFADMCAVAPNVWNNWHEMLLRELYSATLHVFERGVFVEQDQHARADRVRTRVREALGPNAGLALEAFLADMPDRYFVGTPEADISRHFELARRFESNPLVMRVTHFPEREFSEFTVVTHDRPGLFAKITGALTAHGMNIAGASITTSRGGMALDVFRVSHITQPGIAESDDRWERLQVTVSRVLAGEADIEELVARARRPSILDRRAASRVPTRVDVDNNVSEHYTVLDVYTHDRVGILFAITNTLFHLGLTIHLAKITTTLEQVLDVFYVTDLQGKKITAPERLDEIREAVIAVLEPPSAPALSSTPLTA